MPIYSRPLRLESFIFVACIGALSLTSACDSPPSANSRGDGLGKAPESKADAKVDSKGPAEPIAKKGPGPKTPPEAKDDGCARYCFDATPCGDACLEEGKTCDKPEGQACAADKRPLRTFTAGWQPRPNSGILRPDVFPYNKAQGDPIDGAFTLAMAFEGDADLADTSKGTLTATFNTSMGAIECELYEDKAPLTVANFVGLARGVRPYLDPRNRKSDEWVKGAYYDNTIFHRVIEGFMIQAGDPSATGRGTPGYFIPDEFHPSLRHTGAGILSMANRNPYDRATQKPKYDEKTGLTIGNTGSAQFFITVTKTQALNDRHTIFGRCDEKVPLEISKVRTQSRPLPDKPFEDVTIETISFSRKAK